MGVSRRIRGEEVGWVNSRRGMARTKFTDSGDRRGFISGFPFALAALIPDGVKAVVTHRSGASLWGDGECVDLQLCPSFCCSYSGWRVQIWPKRLRSVPSHQALVPS